MTKASELAGPALRWAVALCQQPELVGELKSRGVSAWACIENFHPDTDWSRGGPIIEQHGINVCIQRDEPHYAISPKRRWYAQMDTRVWTGYGPTPLIAAMRCYVTSKLGEEVDIPEELS